MPVLSKKTVVALAAFSGLVAVLGAVMPGHAAVLDDAAQPGRRAYPANAYGAVPSFGARNPELGADRDRALRECTAVEQKTYPTIRDSNLSMFNYRACMNEHGQPE